MTAITPYRISVTDAVLADLKARLRNTRWPEAELVNDLSQGAPLKWIQEICQYWAEEYDWRRREARLNRFSQFTTELDGLNTHFIHVRSRHPGAMPLVITHGWPGSVVEVHKVNEPLTDPTAHGGDAADAFHVVCPSIPGFGFSAKPTTTGWGVDRIASAWATLMARLGYTRYGAQGGDWGSTITASLGSLDPQHCAGIHVTLAMNSRPNVTGEPTPEELRAFAGIEFYREWDSGYATQQSTRPQTVAYGDRRVIGAALLGEFRLEAYHGAPGRCTDRSRRFPEGDHHASAQMDGKPLHRHPALERHAQGRSLRRVRAARTSGPGRAGVFPATSPVVRTNCCDDRQIEA